MLTPLYLIQLANQVNENYSLIESFTIDMTLKSLSCWVYVKVIIL